MALKTQDGLKVFGQGELVSEYPVTVHAGRARRLESTGGLLPT